MISRSRTVELVAPELIQDPRLALLPLPVRLMCRMVRVTTMLRMRVA